MMRFKISKEVKGNRPVVEIRHKDNLIACIYPHKDHIRIVSKHLSKAYLEQGIMSTVTIVFKIPSE